MDPITLIVTALAAGAVAGLKPTAEKAVKDAYEGLKTLIVKKYEKMQKRVDALEEDPGSKIGKAYVEEALKQEERVGQDEAVLVQAKALLAAIRAQGEVEQTAQAADVLIENIEAGADVVVADIVSAGGFTARGFKTEGGVRIEGVRTGGDADAGKADRPGA